ncbi:putative adhesin [Stackebrandtia albiflava]|uniref:Putative adhesin n=1 Tax=Stackebrandtia albiflava TaxID=406432 RepID=A0A562UYR2_9ACTN|nr:DUF4097 family beta strand repeat-containing protein [Stackebrandtia albiflava]TWJ10756.1 putative adhesin [Stackebrandtia albiflava]
MSDDTDTRRMPRGGKIALSLVLGVVILAGAAAAGWAIWRSTVPDHVESRSQMYQQPIDRLVVDNDSGDVEVVAGTGDGVVVERTLRYGDREPEAVETWSGEVLTIDFKGCGREFLPAGACSIDYRIEVPADTVVELEVDSGNIVVEGITADLNLSADSGNIDLENVTGRLDLSADSGDLRGDDLASTDVTFDVDSGDVELGFVEPPANIAGEADSGSVTLVVPDDGAPYRVDATVDSGSSQVEVAVSDTATRAATVTVNSGDFTFRHP